MSEEVKVIAVLEPKRVSKRVLQKDKCLLAMWFPDENTQIWECSRCGNTMAFTSKLLARFCQEVFMEHSCKEDE